ncbi:hypothetical protein CO251_00570 [Sulfobacillus sp. hq2]|nr:hypothetical protein CO251_00570 [Sulfobacillus sp. hq2]
MPPWWHCFIFSSSCHKGDFMDWFLLALSVLVMVYLVYVIVHPEKF